DREVVVEQVDVEIGVDQLVLDELPDDPCHLVAVEFDDRILDLDFRHSAEAPERVFASKAGPNWPADGGAAIALASGGRKPTLVAFQAVISGVKSMPGAGTDKTKEWI